MCSIASLYIVSYVYNAIAIDIAIVCDIACIAIDSYVCIPMAIANVSVCALLRKSLVIFSGHCYWYGYCKRV